jgi:hypothetical protein
MRSVAESFAAQAAVNIVLAEARRERERLSIYEDRDRIARDLHDLVIQRLFATGMQLQGATRHTDIPDDVRNRISRAVDDLDETIREIRQTIFALHEPVDTASDSLRARVLRESSQSGALLGFEPAVRFVGPVDALTGPATSEHVIAVLREALANAIQAVKEGREVSGESLIVLQAVFEKMSEGHEYVMEAVEMMAALMGAQEAPMEDEATMDEEDTEDEASQPRSISLRLAKAIVNSTK